MTDRRIVLLKTQRKLLARRLSAFEEFIRGSVVQMKRRCRYARCRRCAAGEGHPTWVLTESIRGKTHTFYLGQARLAKAKEMVDNYRRLMDLVEQMAQANLELLIHQGALQKGKGDEQSERGP
jgi:ribosomal protein L31